MKRYHFVGIGGSGMSALAQVVKSRGDQVTGSDRCYDRALNEDLFRLLGEQGIQLFPQDGSGIDAAPDYVVVSTAIEKDNPDVRKAQWRKIPLLHRARLLAEIFNPSFGIAVGGTSGKSTVTGMISVILEEAGLDPTVINGGVINSFEGGKWLGNARLGNSNLTVIETDESDGSIVNFSPRVGVITNISRDHKDTGELLSLFAIFAQSVKDCLVINGDCPLAEKVRPQGKRIMTFGFAEGVQIKAENAQMCPDSSRFQVRGISFHLPLPGRHNISNALAAIGVAHALDIDLHSMREALEKFRGIKRRLELIGKLKGISVFDDFSHNPAKIASAIETLRMAGDRLIVIFQPHGYGPTKFLLKELAEIFNQYLLPADYLLLLKIYDAGGSAERTVSSLDLLREVRRPAVLYCPERDEVISEVKRIAQTGDVVVLMGARDDTLSSFVRRLAHTLQGDEM